MESVAFMLCSSVDTFPHINSVQLVIKHNLLEILYIAVMSECNSESDHSNNCFRNINTSDIIMFYSKNFTFSEI